VTYSGFRLFIDQKLVFFIL